MLKIIVPLATAPSSRHFPRRALPHVLTEFAGQPLLEAIVESLRPQEPHQFVFVLSTQDADRWALDDVARRIAPGCAILVAPSPPKSSIHASLLAFDEIELDGELLMAEPTSLFQGNIESLLAHARSAPLEGCVATFRCTHPKWNYLRLENGEILQVVANRPVSDQAAAGLLWIRRARDYFEAAERHVVRQLERCAHEDTSSVVNELVLAGRRIGRWQIPSQASARPSEPIASHRQHRSKSTANFADS